VLFTDVYLPLSTFWLRSHDEAMPVTVLTLLVSIQWGVLVYWLRSHDEAMPVMVLTFLVSIQWGIIGLLAP
jgi:hypothetical protein